MNSYKRELLIQGLCKTWNYASKSNNPHIENKDIKSSVMESMMAQIIEGDAKLDMSSEDYHEWVGVIAGWDSLEGHEDEWRELVEDAAARWLVSEISMEDNNAVRYMAEDTQEIIDALEGSNDKPGTAKKMIGYCRLMALVEGKFGYEIDDAARQKLSGAIEWFYYDQILDVMMAEEGYE